jgi:hypothetical protein
MHVPVMRHHVPSELKISFLVGVAVVFSSALASAQQRPRVFITDSQSWETVGSAAGSGGTFAASSRGGARPQTAEIIKTFGERCPSVLINNKQDKADYVVVLDHEGGKGYLQRRNKIAVFNKDGDAIVSRSTRSLGNSVQDGCEAIVADWSSHPGGGTTAPQASTIPAQPSPKGTPSSIPAIAVIPESPSRPAPASVSPTTSTSANAATLDVSSSPPGADIEIDGGFGGSTPSAMGVSAGEHNVRISKKGYVPWERKIRISTGNVRVVAELDSATASDTRVQTKPAPMEQTPIADTPTPSSSAATLHPAVMTSVEPKTSSTVAEKPSNGPVAAIPSMTTEEQGTASVTSNPEGAEIFVDSVGLGRAPALLKLSPGKHTIQLVAKGYKDWTGEIEVKGGSIVNVTGSLEK